MSKKEYLNLKMSIYFLTEDIVTTSNVSEIDVFADDLSWQTFM